MVDDTVGEGEPTPIDTPLMAQLTDLKTMLAGFDARVQALEHSGAVTALDDRLKAVEQGIATHSHGMTPEIVQHIASAAKDLTLSHVKERLADLIAHVLIHGTPPPTP